MATPDNRIPANRVGLVVVVLLAAWLAYVFVPRHEKPAPAVAPPVADSKLRAAGLADNPDWEGMPEIFAIWADHAEWTDGKTRFAYWHPGTKTYSYYFEAVRTAAAYRFKVIGEPHDPDHAWDESLGEECPIRFYKPVRLILPVSGPPPSSVEDPTAIDEKPRVPVKIPEVKLPPPPAPKPREEISK